MVILDGKQVIQRYTNWLRDHSKTDCHNDVWRIELPFMNRRRTHFQVFVEKTESGLMISDYGETIGDLRFSGFDIDTETQRRKLDGLLRSFSVELWSPWPPCSDYSSSNIPPPRGDTHTCPRHQSILHLAAALLEDYIVNPNPLGIRTSIV